MKDGTTSASDQIARQTAHSSNTLITVNQSQSNTPNPSSKAQSREVHVASEYDIGFVLYSAEPATLQSTNSECAPASPHPSMSMDSLDRSTFLALTHFHPH